VEVGNIWDLEQESGSQVVSVEKNNFPNSKDYHDCGKMKLHILSLIETSCKIFFIDFVCCGMIASWLFILCVNNWDLMC